MMKRIKKERDVRKDRENEETDSDDRLISYLSLGLLSGISQLLRGLRHAARPAGATVSTGSTAVSAEVTAATATAGVTTVAAVVVAHHVAAAVVRVLHHLVRHVLLVAAEELLQTDDGRDNQCDLADQQSLTGDQGDEAKGEGQKSGGFQGHGHQDGSQDFLGLLCKRSS